MTDVVIIGAGMSGIACARALRAAGVQVRIIDKGRGIGGRVATRRAEVAGQQVTFDHGAQYLDQNDDTATIAELGEDATNHWHLGDGTRGLVGSPEMAALPKSLARGLDITLNTRVTRLTEDGPRWTIQTDPGALTATHVIVTIPAPQLGALLGDTHPVVQRASGAVMHPCMTLMAAFDGDRPAPFSTQRDCQAVLTWIARNDTKPGRSLVYQTWVAQADPGWSAERIDANRDDIKAQMVDLLCDALGNDPAQVRHAGLQGWRYGLVQTPLGQPFVAHGTLWVGGDWCCGPKVQDAWRSGSSIATSVLETLGSSVKALGSNGL
ncbi:MAG: FAD-dependent oxidoreductase [Pseudomonadota bacterium]